MFKVNKLTIKTPERRHWHRLGWRFSPQRDFHQPRKTEGLS